MRHIVWFKRDLRIHDHAPLVEAARCGGELILLYLFEPALWHQPDMSRRHYDCLIECLDDLRQSTAAAGGHLVVRVGEAVQVLGELFDQGLDTTLWSHEETGNGWTYTRDKAVRSLCRSKGVSWREIAGNGVVRCLRDRNGWSKTWQKRMSVPVLAVPDVTRSRPLASHDLPAPRDLGLAIEDAPDRQSGGRRNAIACLSRFLLETGETYRGAMSSPVTGEEHCSRLSVALAYGSLSVREVYQATRRRVAKVAELPKAERGSWPLALRSFEARLRWHCHFMQKLEDQPDIEFRNLHPLYDGLREDCFDENLFAAWKEGRTGFPMVDACMRYLTRTGWLNFRMRAMLMSFASQHLWLHWRPTSLHLARLFTDYEPGIHYPQAQMQSGTTGINTVRIYNPVKQGLDQDPQGDFIRREIPELSHLPQQDLHRPWLSPAGLGDYPAPIVDEATARRAAADKIYKLRRQPGHKGLSAEIVEKHGSRKRPTRRAPTAADRQADLFS